MGRIFTIGGDSVSKKNYGKGLQAGCIYWSMLQYLFFNEKIEHDITNEDLFGKIIRIIDKIRYSLI